MKITIIVSIEKVDKAIKITDELIRLGHKLEYPHTMIRIMKGEMSLSEFKRIKKEQGGDYNFRKQSKINYIKRYFNKIKESDAVLILNFTKNGIKNYIGGNALMELGFAYVLGKIIYLYNPIPKMPYTDEIKDVNPIVINGDLSKIK